MKPGHFTGGCCIVCGCDAEEEGMGYGVSADLGGPILVMWRWYCQVVFLSIFLFLSIWKNKISTIRVISLSLSLSLSLSH